MNVPGQTIREAILQNKLLPVGGEPGPPGAPGPPGVPALAIPHITVIANYVATVNIPIILANGTLTITLPGATGSGTTFWIKNIGVGTVTVDAGVGKTIDGAQSR